MAADGRRTSARLHEPAERRHLVDARPSLAGALRLPKHYKGPLLPQFRGGRVAALPPSPPRSPTTDRPARRRQRAQTLETVTRSGQILGRDDEVGRGLLRMNGRASTLLYRRGFARPPSDVARFLPSWWREARELARVAQSRIRGLRASPGRWRALLWPTSPQVGGVADRLPVVIRATRASLYAVSVGLLLVTVTTVLPRKVTEYVNYAATFCFVGTWAVLKQGVWLADDRWASLAAKDTGRWAWPFLLFSVVGGAALDQR